MCATSKQVNLITCDSRHTTHTTQHTIHTVYLTDQSHRYLMEFLHDLSRNSEVTKMGVSNLGLVIGPNLLWPKGDSRYISHPTQNKSFMCLSAMILA